MTESILKQYPYIYLLYHHCFFDEFGTLLSSYLQEKTARENCIKEGCGKSEWFTIEKKVLDDSLVEDSPQYRIKVTTYFNNRFYEENNSKEMLQFGEDWSESFYQNPDPLRNWLFYEKTISNGKRKWVSLRDCLTECFLENGFLCPLSFYNDPTQQKDLALEIAEKIQKYEWLKHLDQRWGNSEVQLSVDIVIQLIDDCQIQSPELIETLLLYDN